MCVRPSMTWQSRSLNTKNKEKEAIVVRMCLQTQQHLQGIVANHTRKNYKDVARKHHQRLDTPPRLNSTHPLDSTRDTPSTQLETHTPSTQLETGPDGERWWLKHRFVHPDHRLGKGLIMMMMVMYNQNECLNHDCFI